MAVLSTAQRKKLPSSDFALGKGRFPINDKTHAQKALQLAPKSMHAGNLSESGLAQIKRKVHAKFPEIGK